MPGFLETTLHQGYGYLEQTGYVDKARPYVEKARNAVPLIDQAAKKVEEIVPPLITRADDFAEPKIERVRPYVEPRIEQVKETVTPYVNRGVEKYGVVREGSVKYYNASLEKVEQIKEFKDAKTTQIKDFKEAKATQIKEVKDAKVTQLREFTDPKVQQIKDIKDAKVTQIKEFADPKVQQIKDIKDAKVTQIREFTDPKVERIREFAEPKVDKIKGAVEPHKDRVISFLTAMKMQAQKLLPVKIRMLLSLPLLLKTAYVDGTLKEKVVKCVTDVKSNMISKVECAKAEAKKLFATLKAESPKSLLLRIKDKVEPTKAKITAKAEPLLTQAIQRLVPVIKILAPTVATVTQNSLFKKALKIAEAGSEKTLGKERTATILVKGESCIPSVWKVALSAKSEGKKA